MNPAAVIDGIERRRREVTVYAPEETDLAERFAGRNVRVRHRPLPGNGPAPFLVVRDGSGFRGAVSLVDFDAFLAGRRDADAPHEAVLELFDETTFGSLDRRHLVATSRELEDRAYRAGEGTLHVGFQTPEAFRDQEKRYRRFARETDLDVHVYFSADATDWPDGELTFHTEPSVLSEYWFLAFEGEGERFALVAEERERNLFYGGWTYDPALITAMLG
jgi:hypothetical protein